MFPKSFIQKKNEKRNVEAPKKLIQEDSKHTEEKSKSQSEPEAEPKEQAHVTTAGLHSTPNKETESQTESSGQDCSRK